MSSEDDSDAEKKVKIEPMPENKVRYTDFPAELVEKVIRLVAKQIEPGKLDKEIASKIYKVFTNTPTPARHKPFNLA